MPTKLTSLGGTGTGRPGKTLCDLPCSTIKRHNKRQLTPLCKSRFAKMMKVMSIFVLRNFGGLIMAFSVHLADGRTYQKSLCFY